MKAQKASVKTAAAPKAATPSKPVVIQFTSPNGKTYPLLNLEPDKEKFAISLGVKKIAAVLSNLDACKRFVASGGASC